MCCGCGTCTLVCPQKAITMATDEALFTAASINSDACTDCGLCEKVCPILNHENQVDLNHKVYIAYAKDADVRYNGSSGGMFGLIARHIISIGGDVYGAAFDSDMILKCTCAATVDELYPLYKSKYLQSDLSNSFTEIKSKLDGGKSILFVSTPCQVHALKLYLGREYPNLLTVDFVCHGVPSQKLFDLCREYVEERDKIRITSYRFRAKKKNGSTPHYYTLGYIKNGVAKERTSLYLDSPFYYGFQKYITLRDSCYDCRFSYSNRVSDITISDFHEVDKYINGINRFDGVSCFVVNTQKGGAVWTNINKETTFHELDFKMLIENGELMCGGTKKPPKREEFLCDLKNQPFETVAEKHLSAKKHSATRLYYSMPRFIRQILKKALIRK